MKCCVTAQMVGLALLMAVPLEATAAPKVDHFRKALRLTKAGKYRLAIKSYEKVLTKKPKNRQVLSRVGPLYFLVGRFETARARYALATKQLPGFAKGWYYYAYALRRLGSCDAALGAYRKYLRLKPKDPHPYYGMARCAAATRRYGDAKVAYNRFIQMGAKVKRLTAWVLRARRERDTMLKRLAKGRDAKAVQAVLAKAQKAFRSNELLLSEQILKQGIKKYPKATAIVDALADLLIRQRRCNDAVAALRVALRRTKGFVSGRYKLALCLRLSKDYAGAEAAYRLVLKAKPRHPDAHYGLAETLRLQNKYAEALRYYKAYVIIEQRPMEQQYVTRARKRIKELAQLAKTAPRVVARRATPGPRTGPTPAARRVVVMDPQIRAMLEARKRLRQRQQGVTVDSPRTSPRPAARRAGLSWKERRRRRLEERRRQRAEAARRRAEERRKRAEERRRRAEARQAAKRRKQAKRLAKKILDGRSDRLTDEARTVLSGMAEQASSTGKHARATEIYQRLSELRPNDLALTKKLAASATAAGQHKVAAQALAKLHKKNPKDMALITKLRAAQRKAGLPLTPLPLRLILSKEILAARGALKAGQNSLAVRWAKAALAKNSRNGYAYVVLGDVALSQGKRKLAVVHAKRAMSLKSTLAGPYRIIGDYHLRLRDRTTALRFYKGFMSRIAADPSEAHNRIRVQAMVKRLGN